jgi:hypothetical protein
MRTFALLLPDICSVVFQDDLAETIWLSMRKTPGIGRQFGRSIFLVTTAYIFGTPPLSILTVSTLGQLASVVRLR